MITGAASVVPILRASPRRVAESADAEGRGERALGGAFRIHGEDERGQRFATATGGSLQRIPELGLQCHAGAMAGDAEATLNQHGGSLAERSDSDVNIPKRACRRRARGCIPEPNAAAEIDCKARGAKASGRDP